jgi:hypothetical protein
MARLYVALTALFAFAVLEALVDGWRGVWLHGISYRAEEVCADRLRTRSRGIRGFFTL